MGRFRLCFRNYHGNALFPECVEVFFNPPLSHDGHSDAAHKLSGMLESVNKLGIDTVMLSYHFLSALVKAYLAEGISDKLACEHMALGFYLQHGPRYYAVTYAHENAEYGTARFAVHMEDHTFDEDEDGDEDRHDDDRLTDTKFQRNLQHHGTLKTFADEACAFLHFNRLFRRTPVDNSSVLQYNSSFLKQLAEKMTIETRAAFIDILETRKNFWHRLI